MKKTITYLLLIFVFVGLCSFLEASQEPLLDQAAAKEGKVVAALSQEVAGAALNERSTLDILLSNEIIALFAIIALGLGLGQVKVAGLSLGSSGVMFIALLFGHFHYAIPGGIGTLGLILFIYCVGISAGPSFFGAFAKRGMALAQLSILVVVTAAGSAYLLSKIFSVPVELTAGLLAGALTSTPALAAAMDSLGTSGSLVSVGYGIAYPFGVVGVVLFVQLLPRLLKKDLNKEDKRQKDGNKIIRAFVEITNPSVIGKEIAKSEIVSMASCQISRVFQDDRMVPVQIDMTFQKEQILMIVGEEKNVKVVIDYLGKKSEKTLNINIERERIVVVVTSRDLIGKSLKDLELSKKYGITVTRVNRSDMTFVPHMDTVLEPSDRLTVVGDDENLEQFSKAAGHRAKAIHETDLISLSIGILAGIIVGMVPIGLQGSKSFTLGYSGGPLLVALILGHFGRIGKVVGRIPYAAQYLMRELGLIFFLAHAGVKAGGSFLVTVQEYGFVLFGVGAVVTLLPLLIGFIVATFIMKIKLLEVLGGLCGGMTSTPAIGVLTAKTESETPVVSYATAYPVALVLMVILVQFLISLG